MAVVALRNTQQRNQFFQQSILGNLHYWQGWLADKVSDTTALDRERNGLLRAISFALDFDEAWALVYELIVTISPYMERRGYLESWHWVLNRAVEVAQQKGEAGQLVTLYHLLARVLNWQSHFQESVAYYRRTIQLARQIGDHFNEGRACTNLGFFYIEQGHWYRAEVLCRHALRLFEDIDSDHGRAHTENHLGYLYTRQRRCDEAQQHLERACSIWESMGDDYGLMLGFMNLGLLYNEMEQPIESLAWSEKALDQAKLIGEALAIGTIYMNMGIAHRRNGDLEKAEAYYQQAGVIFRRFSNSLGLAQVWGHLGVVYLYQEKWEDAIRYMEMSLDAFRNLNNREGEIETLINIIEYELTRENRLQTVIRLREVENLISQHTWGKEQHDYLKNHLEKYHRSLSRLLT